MLAALLQNNNNARQQPQPGFKADPRSSGGRSRHVTDGDDEQRGQHFDIVDIMAAAATFPEIVGENPAARTARRIRWIGEALPFVKEAREKREAAVFLAGIQLGAATVHAERAATEKLSIAQLIQIIDEVRSPPPVAPVPSVQPVPRGRGTVGDGSGFAIALGLMLGGVVIGSLISGARKKRRGSGSLGF